MNVTKDSVFNAAQNTGRTLTLKQVNQILRRREQLMREARNLQGDKYRQIEWCWRWWYGEE
jgi:hypothetical protein